MCIEKPNFIKIEWLQRYCIQRFQNGDCPPFWICGTNFGTTHDEYFMVSITEQTVVVIASVVLIKQKV